MNGIESEFIWVEFKVPVAWKGPGPIAWVWGGEG